MATDFEKVKIYTEVEGVYGLPENAAGIGEVHEPNCEDVLRIGFSTKREIITEIGYTITESACMTVRACAAAAIELAKNKAVMAAYLITHQDIAKLLSDNGELNKENVHCAMMAELALKQAIVNYARQR